MNAKNVLTTNDWVKSNANRLRTNEFGSQAKVAKFVSEELGFKVSTNVLRDLMSQNGIETKRVSEAKRKEIAQDQEIAKLNDEVRQLKTALGKVKAADFIPDDLKQFVFAGLDDEITAALSTN